MKFRLEVNDEEHDEHIACAKVLSFIKEHFQQLEDEGYWTMRRILTQDHLATRVLLGLIELFIAVSSRSQHQQLLFTFWRSRLNLLHRRRTYSDANIVFFQDRAIIDTKHNDFSN